MDAALNNASSSGADPAAAARTGIVPLFVDLDGTLIATDMFGESLVLACKEPRHALRLPGWLLQGRPTLKRAVAERAGPTPSLLPLQNEAVEFVEAQRRLGRPVILATATDIRFARQAAERFGPFDDVLATDGGVNLKGANKLVAIENWSREQGYEKFAYMGDAHADLPIWRQAAEAHVVAPSRRLLAEVEALGRPTFVYGQRPSRLRAVLRVIRPYQWVKNILLAVSLLLAHELTDLAAWTGVFWAFLAFSSVASSVYVLNDLLDIENDRRHDRKKNRPFASGRLPVGWGPPLTVGLAAAGFAISGAMLPVRFTELLAVYLVCTLLYSFWLKRKSLIDVLLLAGLYTLRIIAGGEAADAPISEWLMALSLFLFTSLAFAKRYAELVSFTESEEGGPRGRGYRLEDLRFIEIMGPTSGYMAVLVLALYIHSPDVSRFYFHPRVLWLVCPLLFYWVGRLWLIAMRRRLEDDPIVFALTDKVSLTVGVLVAIVSVIATIPWTW